MSDDRGSRREERGARSEERGCEERESRMRELLLATPREVACRRTLERIRAGGAEEEEEGEEGWCV
eukprot:888681-Rhodomonas_salina.1